MGDRLLFAYYHTKERLCHEDKAIYCQLGGKNETECDFRPSALLKNIKADGGQADWNSAIMN